MHALRDFYPDIAALYSTQDENKLAYDYLPKASSINDSVFNSDNNKVVKEMDAKFRTGEKEIEIVKQ